MAERQKRLRPCAFFDKTRVSAMPYGSIVAGSQRMGVQAMNGFSLLLAFASLSVVYSWRTGVDQQQEYVLQIEPEIVQALSAGEEIFSDVPVDAGPFQRLAIQILPKEGVATRHTATGEEQFRQLLLAAGRYASRDRSLVASDNQPTILWPSRAGASPEQTYGVATGWQSDASGNPQYLVQIDPTVLSTLSIGDELYVPIDPAAGRIVRFVVKSGRGNLPRLGGAQSTSLTPPLQNLPRSRFPSATDQANANWNNSTAPDLLRQPSRFNNGYSDSPAVDSRGNPITSPPLTNAPGQSPGTYGFGQAPGYGGNQPGYNNPNPNNPNHNNPGFNNLGLNNPGYNNQGFNNSGYNNQPTSNYPQFGVPPGPQSNFDQYRGAVDNQGFPLQTAANQQPQLPNGQRQFRSQFPETRVAGLPQSPLAAATSALNPNSLLTPQQLQQLQQQDKPWGPLLFVTFALFFSIGGNLYLAYTALEFHGRYRSAIERLRSASRSA
jgi:hypothetical protein